MQWSRRYKDVSGNADVRIRHERECVRLEATTAYTAVIMCLSPKAARALGRELLKDYNS